MSEGTWTEHRTIHRKCSNRSGRQTGYDRQVDRPERRARLVRRDDFEALGVFRRPPLEDGGGGWGREGCSFSASREGDRERILRSGEGTGEDAAEGTGDVSLWEPRESGKLND